MERYVSAAGIALVAALCSTTAQAEVIEIGASKDNTLYQSSIGNLSNGMGEHFFAGRSNQSDEMSRRRGVIAFDVAAAVPAGSIINNVTLTLRMSRTQAPVMTVSLHRLLADWGEGQSVAGGQEGAGGPAMEDDATWLHRFYPTMLWTTTGGDSLAAPSASTGVGGNGFYNWTGASMVADVQMWLDFPASNFGWIVVGDESIPQTAKRFDSRQNSNASRRPRLTIDFTPPAASGACCFDDGTCVVLSSAQCAGQSGSYQGEGTSCTPNPCPPPTGACCFTGLTCQELTEVDCDAQGGLFLGAGTNCVPFPCPVLLEPFVDALPIPAVAEPVSGTPGGEASYAIAMTQFTQQLHRDLPPTTVWGYDGSTPGPVIEAYRDQPVTVTWINDLRDENGDLREDHYLPVDLCLHGPDMHGNAPLTVVHLHGGHVPADVDGYPEATFQPGEQVTYVYPNNQPAGSLWFHDHALGITRLNVYMGLAGFYALRDDVESALNLPSGDAEIPLVIQDRSFHVDGTLSYPAAWEDHFFGDFVMVNGKVWPYLEVNQGTYRFRVLNGSNSRVYHLSLSNDGEFHQIGTELGLLPAPVPLTSLLLAPGERADIIIDFAGYAPGTEILIVNDAPAPYPGEPGVGVVPNIMKFIVGAASGHTDPIPPNLATVEPISEDEAVEQRDLLLRMFPSDCTSTIWMINGLEWDEITEFPQLGTTEVWRFINRSGVTHPMHMHLVMFQVLDRQPFQVVGDDIVPIGEPSPPEPNEAGWKDTVRVDPFEMVRVIARFEDYTGLYPYHCHILEHEDHEMMRQFEVVPACPADLTGDGVVNIFDLLTMLGQWGECDDCTADLNRDDTVNVFDLLIVLGSWGDCDGND